MKSPTLATGKIISIISTEALDGNSVSKKTDILAVFQMLLLPPATAIAILYIMSVPFYRFRIVAGPQYGKTFSVDEKGALIGRSENCDVIILDPSLSRHHCRIFLRDGLLWVADLKSANCTEVDGARVQEAPLWKNRRISIGDTTILVESDGGVPSPNRSATYQRFITPLTVICCTIAIALAAYAFFLWIPPTPSEQDTATPTAQEWAEHTIIPYLGLDYYRIQADTNTIHTMHFQILPPDVATIRIEDLATNRDMHRSVPISRYQIEILSRNFAESGFFSLASEDNMDTSPSEIRIQAFVNNRQHIVRNPVGGGSASFRNLAAQIETTAATLFGNWIHDFSDQNLMRLAQQKLAKAQEDADVTQSSRHDHLYTAVQDLEYAAWLVRSIRPSPDIATDIARTRDQYRRDLDAHIQDIFAEADRAAQRNDTEAETELLRLILARLPDDRDLRYRTASDRLQGLSTRGGGNHAP